MTWLRQAWTEEEASDITDNGDALRLAASGYVQLSSRYVHLISIAVTLSQGHGEGRAGTVGKAIPM